MAHSHLFVLVRNELHSARVVNPILGQASVRARGVYVNPR